VQEITRWRALVGSRVAVRHRLSRPDPATGATLTDVVGDLVAVLDGGVPDGGVPDGTVPDGGVLRVAARGGTVDVPLATVVAGRPVPPRPSRVAPPHLAVSVTDLVAVMARHWNPADGERLGGWWLRAADGFTNRANSVLPLGDPEPAGDAAVDRALAWYAARGLVARASIAGPVAGGVPDDGGPAGRAGPLLRGHGWSVVPDGSALVLVAPTAALRTGPELPPELRMTAAPEPDPAWLAAYRYRGQELPPQAVELLLSAPEQAFWSVRDGDRTVAVARGSLAGGWAGVTAVEVVAEHRRRGLARVLLAAVARWAGERGAASCYLQTAESNLPAQRLYTSAGFVPHHRYDYLVAPDPAARTGDGQRR
jgi:N-acetylglutamate synthase